MVGLRATAAARLVSDETSFLQGFYTTYIYLVRELNNLVTAVIRVVIGLFLVNTIVILKLHVCTPFHN